mmetsp:Transcript_17197/g.56302  ORF Transcript_17197/g.56302 Transcript_17197/m.56302 type:complete len:214 (+) Transcript_17197:29-670(+)
MGLTGFVIKQCALMAVIYSVPLLTASYLNVGFEQVTDPEFLAGAMQEARFTIAVGAALFVTALTYKLLPIDLIPDWMPFVGRIDDMIAGVVMGAGAALAYTGYMYGKGPKPPEVVGLVTLASEWWAVAAPYASKLWAVALVVLRVLEPLTSAATEALLALLREAQTRCGPLLSGVSEKLLAKAAAEAAEQGSSAGAGAGTAAGVAGLLKTLLG